MYSSTIFELVENPKYTFYKLYFNGKCQFDDFLEKIQKIPQDAKNMNKVVALMDMFGCYKLPITKFRQIKNMSRPDVFEFKSKNIRVYVIFQKPNVYIALGGYKDTQDRDIKLLKERYRRFPLNNDKQ